MNDKLFAFLVGGQNIESFIADFQSDVDLQRSIRELIPEEAKQNSTNPLWSKFSYSAFEKLSFDFYKYLVNMCSLSGTIPDNYNLFSSLKRMCEFTTHDNIPFSKEYDGSFSLYLDIARDCFDGPEVQDYLEQIIRESLSLPQKTAQRKFAKKMVEEGFQTLENKRPQWIQGAEWPMGKNRPMLFEKQKKKAERVQYYFRDIDTGEGRVIIQYY